jgi:hypothetical protein
MITPELKNKLSKIYELVKRGSEGEKQAAQKALDKLLSKYNIEGIDLNSLDKKLYIFKYKTDLDHWLLVRIVNMLIDDTSVMGSARRRTGSVREILLHLRYLDYIIVESSYEYFRRHMKKQWDKVCAVEVNRCRKAKTKNNRREQLKPLFFDKYCILSNLVKPEELIQVELKSTDKDFRDRMKMTDIEGGNYTTQLHTGLLLN